MTGGFSMPNEVCPILRLSLWVAGTAVCVAGVIGVPLGLWLGRSRFRGSRAAWAAVYTGMALPPVVVGLLVYLLLSRSGPFGFLGWLYTPSAMIFAQVLLRGTFLSLREELELVVLSEGDALLRNRYSVITVNTQKHAHVNAAAAKQFADFLTDPGAKKLIAAFGVDKLGEPLFFPEK